MPDSRKFKASNRNLPSVQPRAIQAGVEAEWRTAIRQLNRDFDMPPGAGPGLADAFEQLARIPESPPVSEPPAKPAQQAPAPQRIRKQKEFDELVQVLFPDQKVRDTKSTAEITGCGQ